jgi:7-cyano-7-deazaguanine reductase
LIRNRPGVRAADSACDNPDFTEGAFIVTKDLKTILETFDNPVPDRHYTIEHNAPEFTSVCPKTGQPDFGTIVFRYVPDAKCVELKSLKLYLQAYRDEGIFYEQVTNRILDDFVAVVQPRQLTIESRWTPRGGLHSVITVTYPDSSND